MMNLLKKMDSTLASVLRCICIFSLAGVFIMYIANVVIRFLPFINFTATDEVAEMLMGWLIFFGAAELVREGKHFIVDLFVQKVDGTLIGKIFKILVFLISIVFVAVLFYYGLDLISRSTSVSTTLRIPKKAFYACIPISAFIMGIYFIRDFILIFVSPKEEKKETA